jgi:hypothetical protein
MDKPKDRPYATFDREVQDLCRRATDAIERAAVMTGRKPDRELLARLREWATKEIILN